MYGAHSGRNSRATRDSQIAATGEETLENLEELEMIFGGVSELGGLERCTRLRSLTREHMRNVERGEHMKYLHRHLA